MKTSTKLMGYGIYSLGCASYLAYNRINSISKRWTQAELDSYASMVFDEALEEAVKVVGVDPDLFVFSYGDIFTDRLGGKHEKGAKSALTLSYYDNVLGVRMTNKVMSVHIFTNAVATYCSTPKQYKKALVVALAHELTHVRQFQVSEYSLNEIGAYSRQEWYAKQILKRMKRI